MGARDGSARHGVGRDLGDLHLRVTDQEAEQLSADVAGAADDRDLHRRPTATACSTIRPATSTPVAAASALNSGVGLTSWTTNPDGLSMRSTARTPPPTASAARIDSSESSSERGVASVVAPRAALVRQWGGWGYIRARAPRP